MQQYTIMEVTHPDFPKTMVDKNLLHSTCIIKFTDKSTIEMRSRVAVVHSILWRLLTYFGFIPTKNDVYIIKYISDKSFSKIHSVIYKKLIKLLPNTYYMQIIEQIQNNLIDISRFISSDCRAYSSHLDLLSLCRMMKEEPIAELLKSKHDLRLGTKIAEIKANQITDKFTNLITTKGAIKNDILFPYAVTNNLSRQQLPQCFIAYGTRSDVNDLMMKHIINESALSGLKSEADYGVESLSTRKATYYSKTVIKKSQYFARKLKLSSLPMIRVYPGDCGNRQTISVYIKEKLYPYFINKLIVEDGNIIELTLAMKEKYSNKTVNMISPTTCRYTDGFCEHCAGRGNNNLGKYLPPDIHVGMFAVSEIASRVSQLILSAKHLIKTDSVDFIVPENAITYLTKDHNSIFLDVSSLGIKDLYLRVSHANLQSVTDIKDNDQKVNPKKFSRIKAIEFIKDNTVLEYINMTEKKEYLLHLSGDFLRHMRKTYDKIKIEKAYVDIPLEGFPSNIPFMVHTIHNDDMQKFVDRVNSFISGGMSVYTSISECFKDFTDMLFSKPEACLNVLFVEILIRLLMIRNDGEVEIPVVTDVNDVRFDKMNKILTQKSIGTKLGFEEVPGFLETPLTYTKWKPKHSYDVLFGL